MTAKRAVTTVTSKGQITIPVEIRRQFGICEGDKIEFIVTESGEIQVERMKYPTIASIAGIAGSLKEPKTWDETEASVREERAEAVVRKLRG